MGLKSRLKRIEAATRPSVPTLPTYHCIIEGEAQVMTLLEFTYTTVVAGKQGTRGDYAGERELEGPFMTPEELSQWFDEVVAEYNSPEAVAQRQAEYEELQRIGELRRQDFECGRNMDECHPLPWQNRRVEHE